MIAKHKKRIVITLPKDLDEFLELVVKSLNKSDKATKWTKSMVIEKSILINLVQANMEFTKDEEA